MKYSLEKSNLKKTNKVFIFGASGFIGKVLLGKINNESETIGVGRKNEEVFFDLNYSDPKDLKSYVSKGDIWIFLAAISSPDECESNPDLAFKVNVTKTKRLIGWLTSQGVKVIFTSSDAVYSGIDGCVDDDETPRPIGVYASHKASVENYVRDNSLVKVVRFSYILGHGDKFSDMLRASEKSNKKLDIFLGFERCVVLLDDVVLGIQSLIDNWDRFDFKYINFCGPFLVDRVEMTKILKEKFFPSLDYYPREAPTNFWIGRVKKIHLDHKNFSKVLGRSPKSINELLRDL